MSGLTRAEVEELAVLARLELTEDELARMQVDLAAILVHMEALAEVDTSAVAPMTHAVPMDLRLRKDEPQPSLPVEVALRAAPDARDGHFRVPNIIKTQEGA
ncbi:MAG: Asp-tRNA(Asn)/Glu-tRNA(Gln) amidotransferase subunit GatC [Deltaproteobacteria bacterium]|nr:Asp-tRNA(Asn)/Glu-tRNA(Gln) amidotransferase subunit GatC [Deltaproteobacteria bacterium]